MSKVIHNYNNTLKPPNWTLRKQKMMQKLNSPSPLSIASNIDYHLDKLSSIYKENHLKAREGTGPSLMEQLLKENPTNQQFLTPKSSSQISNKLLQKKFSFCSTSKFNTTEKLQKNINNTHIDTPEYQSRKQIRFPIKTVPYKSSSENRLSTDKDSVDESASEHGKGTLHSPCIVLKLRRASSITSSSTIEAKNESATAVKRRPQVPGQSKLFMNEEIQQKEFCSTIKIKGATGIFAFQKKSSTDNEAKLYYQHSLPERGMKNILKSVNEDILTFGEVISPTIQDSSNQTPYLANGSLLTSSASDKLSEQHARFEIGQISQHQQPQRAISKRYCM